MIKKLINSEDRPQPYKLTMKNKAYCHELVKNKGDSKQAYINTYGVSGDIARAGSGRLNSKPEIQSEVQRILNSNKKSKLAHVINRVTEDLEATKEVVYNSRGDIIEIKDNSARSSAQDKLLRMHQVKGITKVENHITDNSTKVIQIESKDVVQLGELAQQLARMNSNTQFTGSLQSGEVMASSGASTQPVDTIDVTTTSPASPGNGEAEPLTPEPIYVDTDEDSNDSV